MYIPMTGYHQATVRCIRLDSERLMNMIADPHLDKVLVLVFLARTWKVRGASQFLY